MQADAETSSDMASLVEPPTTQLATQSPSSVTTTTSQDAWSARTLESKLISYEGLQCYAKIRKSLALSSNLQLVVGADCRVHPKQDLVKPMFSLRYKVERNGSYIGTLALNQDRVSLQRSIPCKFKTVSCRLDTAAELTFSGTPLVGVNVGEVKPWPVPLLGALILYCMGKPVRASKAFGSFRLELPLSHLSLNTGKAEAKLCLQKGQPLHLEQLNAQMVL